MLQIILIVVLVISLSVLLGIFVLKIPILSNLPQEQKRKKEEKLSVKIKKRILNISAVKNFSWNAFLQKILSKTRIVILKIENKIGEYLSFLRKKSLRPTKKRKEKKD